MKTKDTFKEFVLPRILDKFTPRIQELMKNYEKIKFTHPLPPFESCYVYGKPGTGKTILVTYMLIKELERRYLNNEKLPFFEFLQISELFQEMRKRYERNEQVVPMLETYSNTDILILDDIGVERPGDWTWDNLFYLINRRYEYLKITLITSNLSLSQLTKKLNDDRISSRIERMCKIIELKK